MIHIRPISFVFRARPDSENSVEQTPGKKGIFTLTSFLFFFFFPPPPFFFGGGGELLHLYCVYIALIQVIPIVIEDSKLYIHIIEYRLHHACPV